MTGALGRTDSETTTANGGIGSDARPAEEQPKQPKSAKSTRPTRRTGTKATQPKVGKQDLNQVRKQMQATARGQRAKPLTTAIDPIEDSSTASLEESAPLDLTPSPEPVAPGSTRAFKRSSILQPPGSVLRAPGSVLRLQGTPAMENSLLALRNFQRRPRQPSMLQMVQQRTASARPSAVYNTDLEDSTLSGLDLGLDVGLDSDDGIDDFAPEAEGTPLHFSRNVRSSSVIGARSESVRPKALVPSSGTRKRKSSDLDVSSGSLNALRERRQRPAASDARNAPASHTDTLHHPSQAPPEPDAVEADASEILVINSDTSSVLSTLSSPQHSPQSQRSRISLDNVIPSTEEDQHQQQAPPADNDEEILSATFAEPASSSPIPTAAPDNLDHLREPLSQASPSPPKKMTRSRKQAKAVLTTSTLQSLLPKRRRVLERRPRQSEYDFGGSSSPAPASPSFDASEILVAPRDHHPSLLEDDSSGDELATRRRRQGSQRPQPTPASHARSSAVMKSWSARPTTTGNRFTAASARKTPAQQQSLRKTALHTTTTASKKSTATRKYGRRSAGNPSSDKENDYHDNEEEGLDQGEDSSADLSMTMHEAAQGPELEAARKKFAEVDGWDLEFESMSAEEHRSSSQGWR